VYFSAKLVLFQDKKLFSSILQHKEAGATDMKIDVYPRKRDMKMEDIR